MASSGSREASRRLLTIAHVAARLDCSVRFVWTQIAQGHLTRIVLSARATRIAESEVDAFIEARTKRQLQPGPSQGRTAKLPRSQPGRRGS